MTVNTVRNAVAGALVPRFFCADCADPGAHMLDAAHTHAFEGTHQDGGGR